MSIKYSSLKDKLIFIFTFAGILGVISIFFTRNFLLSILFFFVILIFFSVMTIPKWDERAKELNTKRKEEERIIREAELKRIGELKAENNFQKNKNKPMNLAEQIIDGARRGGGMR